MEMIYVLVERHDYNEIVMVHGAFTTISQLERALEELVPEYQPNDWSPKGLKRLDEGSVIILHDKGEVGYYVKPFVANKLSKCLGMF